MPLLCMYILCSLVLIYQVLVVLPGVYQSLVWSLLCLSPPSILGLLPFRRPELEVYCVVCIF
jgi:hypothetical protein